MKARAGYIHKLVIKDDNVATATATTTPTTRHGKMMEKTLCDVVGAPRARFPEQASWRR